MLACMGSRSARTALAIAAIVAVAGACSTKQLTTTDTTAGQPSTTTTAPKSETTRPRSSNTTAATGTTATTVGGDATPVPDPTWGLNAVAYRGQNGVHLRVDCPADGTIYSVWGTGTYTDDSSICTAAVHAGLITLASGGSVVIEIAPGLQEYTGTEANGILTTSYGPWDGSYTFVG